MKNRIIVITLCLIFLLNHLLYAAPSITQRTEQFSNDKVSVWETIIYPSANQILKMHRHDHDRVVVAFNRGLLKITNDQGKVHYLKLEKNKAYYLTKDVSNELHRDQNMLSEPLKVLVIELKN